MKRFLTLLIFLTICVNVVVAENGPNKSKKEESKEVSGDDGIFSAVHDASLLKNPGFENQTSNWTLGKLNGGTGIFKTDTSNAISGQYSAILELNNDDKEYSDVQLFTSLPIKANTLYMLAFQARVKSNCNITISINNGIDRYADFSVQLEPKKLFYGPFVFESQQDDPFTSFAFNLGKAATEIQLDDVQIEANNNSQDFEEVLSKSRINFHLNSNQESLFVQLPIEAENDYPVLFQNESGAIVQSGTISRGAREKQFELLSLITHGAYTCKVFLPEGTLTYSFKVP